MITDQQRTLHRLIQKAPHEIVPGILVLRALDLEFPGGGSWLWEHLAFSDGFHLTLDHDGIRVRLEEAGEARAVFDLLSVAVATIYFGIIRLEATDLAQFGAERRGLLVEARRINRRSTGTSQKDLLAGWKERLERILTERDGTGTEGTESREEG